MIPWEQIDTAQAPGGGVLTLHRRGDEHMIRIDGAELMSTRKHGSESALAELALAELRDRASPCVLIGGLGVGYTLAATLAACGPDARIVQSELSDAVVRWNEEIIGAHAGHPLRDPRVRVEIGDVVESIARARNEYDAILLDVDNGPDALTRPSNAKLYRNDGLGSAHRALTKGGVLAIWSAAPDDAFTRTLARAGFDVRVTQARGVRGRGVRHTLWLAIR
jgi:spermidine synthase